ncbi:MAG: hypothetical protein AAFZ58_06320 [Pseudomonadota bacterium]
MQVEHHKTASRTLESHQEWRIAEVCPGLKLCLPANESIAAVGLSARALWQPAGPGYEPVSAAYRILCRYPAKGRLMLGLTLTRDAGDDSIAVFAQRLAEPSATWIRLATETDFSSQTAFARADSLRGALAVTAVRLPTAPDLLIGWNV